jgi:hypothetical protein
MHELIRQPRPYIYRRKQRGQTLIVAVAVLFVLLFVGGIFVAQVARNLIAAGYSRDVQDARALAEAGIQYCDTQLTNSMDGADWRPAPTPPVSYAGNAGGVTDPDYFWLEEGFSRVSFNGGRALVRVTYDPQPGDPRSQLLKIESVGRSGDLGTNLDPTVFVQNGPAPRLRAELIAYKQIGITDYLRFFTHKERNSVEDFLGMPPIGVPVGMALGNPLIAQQLTNPSTTNLLMGAPIRSNGNLRLEGPTYIYENPTRPFEGMQVTGQILVDQNNATVYVNQDPNAATINAANQVLSSTDPNHTTNNGIVRDGSTQTDPFGYSNTIPYLDPPSLDTLTDGTGVLRYRALTRDSGMWGFDAKGGRFNTGQNGWGRGIYVNNTSDQQKETTAKNLAGSYSLRADWLNPNNQFAQSYWEGPFYNPPGIQVELLGDRIRLTRSDGSPWLKPDGTPITAQGGSVIEIPLADDERSTLAPDGKNTQGFVFPDGTSTTDEQLPGLPLLDHDGDEVQTSTYPKVPTNPNSPFGDKNSYGVNVVIMAEGNVRVKGVYGVVTDSRDTSIPHLGRVHLTIVSGGTAYIDGNVVKGDGYLDSSGTQHLEHASTCAILAHDYVCVNTTQFMAPQNQTNVFSRTSPDLEGFNAEIGQSRTSLDMGFSSGLPLGSYMTTPPNGTQEPSSLFLLLRHAALNPGPAYINLLVNPALVIANSQANPPNPPNNPLYLFNMPGGAATIPQETYILGMRYDANGNVLAPDQSSITPSFEMRAFPLNPNPNALYPYPAQGSSQYNGQNVQLPAVQTPGLDNTLRFQIDQTAPAQSTVLLAGTDYLLGSAMVAPLDIRIEALLYAQEHSFFVIPGYSLNPDPKDSRQSFISNDRRVSYSVDANGNLIDSPADKTGKDIYPFYNEPVDARITIFGAVAENYSASANDQAAWLARWGYIPAAYGSTGLDPNTPAIPVPDIHLMLHDPVVGDYAYTPGDDLTQDLRLAQEKTVAGFPGGITRGLRFLYDPALCLPYQNPTDLTLNGDGTPQDTLRQQRALRAHVWPKQMSPQNNSVQLLPEIRQILPPMPKLPVCPGLLYFGDSERRIGT